ncbi:MAG: hypothetical protein ACFCU8_04525 [Thermosynechococcaceae cyanobacterium]
MTSTPILSLSPTRYLTNRSRINYLIDEYLAIDCLSNHLTDLKAQFITPYQRPWGPVYWQEINPDQIVSIDPEIFLELLAGAAEVESPIRSYSRESWDYLQQFHPEMATFLGGTYGPDQSIQVVGIWEKEERQHAPALRKMYQQLTGHQLTLKPNSVQGYHASNNLQDDIYHHLVSRLSSEWSAISLYLWLMAHSTGALRGAIAQILQDEVNHLAKFWGFSRWAFGRSFQEQFLAATHTVAQLFKHYEQERSHGSQALNTHQWLHQLSESVELMFTFLRVMVRIRRWDTQLSTRSLNHLFEPRPLEGFAC